jgi:hypothetical protein
VPPLEQARAGVPREPTGTKAHAPGPVGEPGQHGTTSRAGGPGPPLAGEPPRRWPRRREMMMTASGCQAHGRSQDRGGGCAGDAEVDPSVYCFTRRHQWPSGGKAPTYPCTPPIKKLAPSQVCLTMGRRCAR